ncbi:MAG TPA: cobalamin-dependent protein [Solirubrobacterales bacterium]|nr:cobalamin-dependent protein [Solirubrobacterales bacterium]
MGGGGSKGSRAARAAARLSRNYLDAVRANDAAGAYRVAARARERGMSLAALYQSVIAPAMHELGRLWEKGAITIADEHLATALTFRVMTALRPRAVAGRTDAEDSAKPRAMFAAVEGEQHALGLRMAADLLEDAGFRSIYLGADVPTEALLQAVDSLSPDVLALTATMPKSGRRLKDTVASVRAARPRLKVMVGGQAVASQAVGEATVVEDLERLEETMHAA